MHRTVFYLFLLVGLVSATHQSYAQGASGDTAIVQSYSGIQVFYHCRPLHPYWSLGRMASHASVSHIRQAFAHYASEAQYEHPGCTGIIIDDVHFEQDSYEVIRTLQPGGYHDTAVLTQRVFMGAVPTRPYEVVDRVSGRALYTGLTATLQSYYRRAQELPTPHDAILVEDLNFGLGRDQVLLIRWK